ncbi:MFS transporter [Frankia sp. QA3]|uniref:MFS transporter n=1 Tax=Frankia sp. QA3 TaxID=710111 RepID=UPI0003054DA7|nr:MFS transporter [Frankia sp. QA3]
MLGGRLGDVAGHRRVLLAGLAVFGAASLAGGLAQTPGELITARAAQGVGAAVLAPIAFSLITLHIPAGPQRARALGLWGAAAALGGAVGVLVGGMLTESAGWRAVLFVNVPVVAFTLVATANRIPADRRVIRAAVARLDLAGAVLATAATSVFVLGIVRTQSHPWSSAMTLSTLATAGVLLAVFVMVESRSARPLLRMGLLAQRTVATANLFVLLLFAGQAAAFYFVSLYLQQVLGYSPTATGVAFVPFALGAVLGSGVAARTVNRFGLRALLSAGGLTAAAGFGWFAVTLTADGNFLTSVLGPSLLTSSGIGLCVVPVGTAATIGVAPAEVGMASSLITGSRQIGSAVGLAALAATAITVTEHHDGAPDTALAAGYAAAVGVSGAMLALAAFLALLLIPARQPVQVARPEPAPAAPVPVGGEQRD